MDVGTASTIGQERDLLLLRREVEAAAQLAVETYVTPAESDDGYIVLPHTAHINWTLVVVPRLVRPYFEEGSRNFSVTPRS
jgi:hypothetical protein